jgi:hypothetical protein
VDNTLASGGAKFLQATVKKHRFIPFFNLFAQFYPLSAQIVLQEPKHRRILAMVFHRILDFKTGQDFYPALFLCPSW